MKHTLGVIPFVVSILSSINVRCLFLDGPGVCIRQQMSKMTDAVQNKTLFCCGGYKEVNDTCVDCPECSSMRCPQNFCGDTCVQQCDCPENAYCDNLYCCVCKPGFYHGFFCNKTCFTGSYGLGCRKKCICQSQQICDPVTGSCTPNSTACEDGYYGQECSNKCMCQREQQCDQVTGNCTSNVYKPACISVVITISRNCKEKYRTTEPVGYFGEINPHDEISLEEFETQQEPLYSTPSYANGVMRPRQSTERYSIMETTNITDALTRSHPNRGCKIHKYRSLPILSSMHRSLEQDNKLKRFNTSSCDQLTRQTLYITESDYLNPYCSLLRSEVSGSDYLNPYTTLLTTTDEGNIYEN